MTKRNSESRCRRCLKVNDNDSSHPSGRRVALCKSCEAARKHEEAERQVRRKSGRVSHLWADVDCAQCGTSFRQRSINQRFCSQSCRNLYLKQWRKESGPTMNDSFPCSVCGTLFIRASGNQKYCSVGCAKAAKDSKQSERSLRNRYLMSSESFRDLYDKQSGCCAICGTRFMSRAAIHVDHDHDCCSGSRSCGQCVRGLLCRNCNTMIGMARDSTDVLRKAIAYLGE